MDLSGSAGGSPGGDWEKNRDLELCCQAQGSAGGSHKRLSVSGPGFQLCTRDSSMGLQLQGACGFLLHSAKHGGVRVGLEAMPT